VIFELAKDFSDALAATPPNHPRHRILHLLEEAIRRDIHFVDRHPTTLFQCLWNSCWWYDCDEAAAHYVEPKLGWHEKNAPWLQPHDQRLCRLLERWRRSKEHSSPGFAWLASRSRSFRPGSNASPLTPTAAPGPAQSPTTSTSSSWKAATRHDLRASQ